MRDLRQSSNPHKCHAVTPAAPGGPVRLAVPSTDNAHVQSPLQHLQRQGKSHHQQLTKPCTQPASALDRFPLFTPDDPYSIACLAQPSHVPASSSFPKHSTVVPLLFHSTFILSRQGWFIHSQCTHAANGSSPAMQSNFTLQDGYKWPWKVNFKGLAICSNKRGKEAWVLVVSWLPKV